MKPEFHRKHDQPRIDGWQLQLRWDDIDYEGELTKGVPHEGHLLIHGYSCVKKNPTLRSQLNHHCLLVGVARPESPLFELENKSFV